MPTEAELAPLQRLLFPQDGDEEALGLYARMEGSAEWGRTGIRLSARSSVSFETYFGALPAGYWREHTIVDVVTLAGFAAGAVTVRICAAGTAQGRRVLSVHELEEGAFALTVPLGGASWIWVEASAGDGQASLRDLRWLAPAVPAATVSVCITTHDRADDCAAVLERIASEPALDALVRSVIVVDQGDAPASGAAGWAGAAARLNGRLRHIRQRNLGGSGGFSRGMIETLRSGESHILLLDDDVALEPESIARLAAFAVRTRRTSIIGAQMLSLVDRTRLHSFGERVEPRGFWWEPVAPELAAVDIAATRVSANPALRRVYDVDFNGWWMCLIPSQVIDQLGAAVPMFIKWDDVEMGLRASSRGIPTVTLPGAALWHMPWTGKDDGLDWQAYFQLRGRLVTALLHSRTARGGGVLRSSFAQDVNHVLCLQYGSAAARRQAMRDVLAGPAHLAPTLARRVSDMRELMADAGQVVVSDADLPAVTGDGVPQNPRGRWGYLRRFARVVAHQMRPEERSSERTVAVSLPRERGKWWALGVVDSALVRSATGSGAFVARRRRRAALSLLRDAAVVRMRLWWSWPALARQYRAQLPAVTSVAAWEALFDAVPSGAAPTPSAH